MRRPWMMMAPLALAACQGDPPDPCGAADYESLLGANIAAVTLPDDLNARIIPPGAAVTMDFVETRLNIETDETGVITRLSCG